MWQQKNQIVAFTKNDQKNIDYEIQQFTKNYEPLNEDYYDAYKIANPGVNDDFINDMKRTKRAIDHAV